MPTIGNTTASESPVPSETYVSGETTISLEDHVADADAHAGIISTHELDTSTHGVGEIVGTTEVQTLSNKTLAAPVITGTLTAAAIEASGNITVGGTLGATSGTFSGTLGVTGNLSVNTNKFVVTALSGNTAIAGDVAVNTNKFTVAAATGNTVIAGTLGVTGDVAVNTNKFNVTAASGNTTIAGTLGVTGNVTVDTNVLYVDTSANKVGINTTPSYPLHVVVNTDSNEVVQRIGNDSAGSSAQARLSLTRGADVGTGTARGGVIFVSGSNFGIGDYEARAFRMYTGASAGSNTERLTILNSGLVGINQSTPTYQLDVTGTTRITGAVTMGSTLGVTGNVAVNTNKFNVTAASGNTTIAGTLGVTGAVTGASFAGSSAAAVLPYGARTYIFSSINDDNADSYSVTLNNFNGIVAVSARSASVFLTGLVAADSGARVAVLSQQSTTADTMGVYAGTLSGTTGTDNQLNIGVFTSGVYVENRTGHDSLKVTITLIGSTS